ncbi:hypothetical protein GCM10023081_20010 [Arthrobacter ginkgonis]|uniref:Uncharacterized protein n=1 Tax=Arthrobacter ginkgonis TaxID=1630594 RepID=A0ABP7C7G9_9MICC
MAGYAFTDRQLRQWPPAAAAAALWERARHMEERANYWKRRAESAEARMLVHHCQEDQP